MKSDGLYDRSLPCSAKKFRVLILSYVNPERISPFSAKTGPGPFWPDPFLPVLGQKSPKTRQNEVIAYTNVMLYVSLHEASMLRLELPGDFFHRAWEP